MNPRRTHWLSVFIFLLTGYALIFAQARIMLLRDLLGTQIDFVPGLMIYAGLAFPVGVLLACAGVLGTLFDSLSANPLGTTIVALSVVGLGGMRFREYLLSDQFATHWFLGLMASAMAPILTVALCRFAGQDPLVGWGSAWHWAIGTAGGGLATPLWFSLFNRLDDALHYKEVPEVTFRTNRQIARGRY